MRPSAALTMLLPSVWLTLSTTPRVQLERQAAAMPEAGTTIPTDAGVRHACVKGCPFCVVACVQHPSRPPAHLPASPLIHLRAQAHDTCCSVCRTDGWSVRLWVAGSVGTPVRGGQQRLADVLSVLWGGTAAPP